MRILIDGREQNIDVRTGEADGNGNLVFVTENGVAKITIMGRELATITALMIDGVILAQEIRRTLVPATAVRKPIGTKPICH